MILHPNPICVLKSFFSLTLLLPLGNEAGDRTGATVSTKDGVVGKTNSFEGAFFVGAIGGGDDLFPGLGASVGFSHAKGEGAAVTTD